MDIQTRMEKVNLRGGEESLGLLHISDIHIWFSRKTLDQLQMIIAGTSPDLIVLTGDYFDTPKGARMFREFLLNVTKR